jgi:hypothetical protein
VPDEDPEDELPPEELVEPLPLELELDDEVEPEFEPDELPLEPPVEPSPKSPADPFPHEATATDARVLTTVSEISQG